MQHDSEPAHEVQTSWFHVFRSMVESGDMASMGPHPVAVYLAIKSCLSWGTGKAFPSQNTLAEKAGISRRTVQRSLDSLVEHGYLSVDCGKQRGVSNVYTLREKLVLRNRESQKPEALATWDYVPGAVQAAVREVQRVALSGDFAGAKFIHIEKLTVNIENFVTGDHFTQFVTELQKIKDPGLRQQFRELYDEAMRRKEAT
jgi:biotin operon repressor